MCPGAAFSSIGPLTELADLVVDVPRMADAGALLRVVVTVRIRTTGPRMITTPATSALVVLSDGGVVARADGAPDGAAVPLILSAGRVAPAQAVPIEVRLVAAGGAALPAGRYAVVAVLGYRSDAFNSRADTGVAPPTGERGFLLVSEPVPLDIR